MVQNRRKHFLINKPLQLRYMFYIVFTLLMVSSVAGLSLYFGIWSGIIGALSDEKIQNDLVMAARLTQYEAARTPEGKPTADALSFFNQAEKLSSRQREIFSGILYDTNRKLIPKFLLLLFFIGWGTIFLSHKIAGPLFRLQRGFRDLRTLDLQTRIYFRKGDEAQFISHEFNDTAEVLDRALARLKTVVAENESNPSQLSSRIKEELAKIKTSAGK